jgi:cytochrome c553
VPGDPAASRLLRAVRYEIPDLEMPKSADKLSDAQIADLETWVRMGAPWPDAQAVEQAAGEPEDSYVISDRQRAWWAFQPLSDPQPPPVEGDDPTGFASIDRFVLARLAAEGIEPGPRASRYDLIRRASYDLIGLPPTAERVAAFVADEAPDSFARLVDELLASPHYGERWARRWLDVVRFGEDDTRGLAEDGTGVERYDTAYTYRDWVIEAFNVDMPFDRFVIGQLAGDLVAEHERAELVGGLGFLGGGPWYYDVAEPDVARADERHDRVDVTTRGFLGLTVGCARCHDHKYDPIPITDYYSLAGVFYNTDYHEYPLGDPAAFAEFKKQQEHIEGLKKSLEEFLKTEARQLAHVLSHQSAEYMLAAWRVTGEPGVEAAEAAAEAKLDLETLERWIAWLAKEPKHYPHFEPWQTMIAEGGDEKRARELAESFERDLLEIEAERKKLEEKNEWTIARGSDKPPDERKSVPMPNGFESFFDKHQLELDSLPRESFNLLLDLYVKDLDGSEDAYAPDPGLFVFKKFGLERHLSATSLAHVESMRAEIEALEKALEQYPFVLGVKDREPEQITEIGLHLRGSPKNLGPPVPRHFLSVLTAEGAPPPFDEGSGRLRLAEAIVAHPLTARVLINRVWRWHFGSGIVDTPSNFGRVGDRPSHPDLLENLASTFVDSGMSIKQLHRRIMLSEAYQRSAEHSAESYAIDPGNRLYWRANQRRLDAEAIRDAMLFAAGSLDPKLGGPSLEIGAADNNRRTVYSRVSRFRLADYLQTFDFANPSLTVGKRFTTNVPLQSLFFMNSEFVERQARNLVNRIEGKPPLPVEVVDEDDKGDTAAAEESAATAVAASDGAAPIVAGPELEDAEMVAGAYRLVYGREVGPAELEAGLSFVAAARGSSEDPYRPWVQYARALFAANEFRFVD